MNAWQACAAQSKLNVTSRKTVHYCIPAAQLYVCEVTRPSFSRRLKGVACETSSSKQKDGAHNLIMTSGSKFGMPAFQVADQVISKICVPAAGTMLAQPYILMFTPSLLTQLTG